MTRRSITLSKIPIRGLSLIVIAAWLLSLGPATAAGPLPPDTRRSATGRAAQPAST